MKYKRFFLITFILLLLICGTDEFLRRKVGGLAGNFPFAESWTVNISENELVEIIKQLKIENSILQVPEDTVLVGDKQTQWRPVLFYYEDSQEKVQVWIIGSYENPTESTILLDYFLGVNDDFTKRRLINRDFWCLENKIQLNKFERVILKPIRDMGVIIE